MIIKGKIYDTETREVIKVIGIILIIYNDSENIIINTKEFKKQNQKQRKDTRGGHSF